MDRGGPAFGTAMAAAAFAVVLLCPGFAVAADAIPLEAFGRLPSLETVVISPDGTKIAFVRTRADSRSLVVAPLNKPEALGGVRIGDTKLRHVVSGIGIGLSGLPTNTIQRSSPSRPSNMSAR